MRFILVSIFFIVFLGCSSEENVDVKMDDSVENSEKIKDTIVEKQEEEQAQEEKINYPEDCVFDMNTQTSEFLEGIKEFENFLWIDSLKTATIPLENGDTIEITRGGCDHYSFYVTLISYSDLTKIEDVDYWINRMEKLTRLISEFENDNIYSLYQEEKYNLIENDNQLYYSFNQDAYCDMSLTLEQYSKKKITITIGYYMC